MINSDPQTKSMYNDEVAELLVFISDTKDGKCTDSKPQIAEIVYSRLTIPEDDRDLQVEDFKEEVVLYGISS